MMRLGRQATANRPRLWSSVQQLVAILLIAFLASVMGCGQSSQPSRVITLWHQMTAAERDVLEEAISHYAQQHPDVTVRALYKETEDLRSGFQAAALAGTGPDLIYGPSDAVGAFLPMGIIQDMQPYFAPHELAEFTAESLIFNAPESGNSPQLLQIGDRVGNHLALVINRDITNETPEDTDALIRIAKENTQLANGRNPQYGLVFNFVEPFFIIPFITGHGGWVFEPTDGKTIAPSLDTPGVIAGLTFVRDLQNKHGVLPAGCDYEMADTLFKSGQAAMIINGDWSWGDYLNNPRIDAEVVPLPIVNATGIPMAPMVAPRGYSLNINADQQQATAAMDLVRYLTSEEVQRKFMARLKTLPSRKPLLATAETSDDLTLQASATQRKQGIAMPVNAELRGVWEAMRPHYQALLGGSVGPEKAAADM